MNSIMEDTWSSAIITGGLGFIGSTLAHRLCEHDKDVHIIDSNVQGYGANKYNISSIENEVEIHDADVRNEDRINSIVKDVGPDKVYHLAAQLSRPLSLSNPHLDIDINCKGSMNILESVRQHSPNAQIVFTSSQAVYGVPSSLPLTEQTDVNPIDLYGVDKFAVEQYCNIYRASHNIDTTILRLTNVYGPRAQLKNPKYGVINKFIKSSLLDDNLTVFKPGTMKRDFVHINDVVDAILAVTSNGKCIGNMYLVGSGNSVSIKNLADHIVETSGKGSVKMIEWPKTWDKIRIGDITTNPKKLQRHSTWTPSIGLQDGLEHTINYYESNSSQYL